MTFHQSEHKTMNPMISRRNLQANGGSIKKDQAIGQRKYKRLASLLIRSYILLVIAGLTMFDSSRLSSVYDYKSLRGRINENFVKLDQEIHADKGPIMVPSISSRMRPSTNSNHTELESQSFIKEKISFDNLHASGNEEHASKTQLQFVAENHVLAPLDLIDREKFTIRISTWKRNEQLITSINHHARCEGVMQIQVVWCDHDADPPPEVLYHASGKVVVERHQVNTLNERFNIQVKTPTKGILSLDDDILRSCEALDSGFFKWTKAPDSIVGYDARFHTRLEDESGWKVSSMQLLSDIMYQNI